MSDDKPSIVELQRIESEMTRGPWTTPAGTRFLGAVSAIIDGVERQVATAAGQAPQFDDVPDVAKALADNAAGIAALRNAAPVLLEIAAAALAWQDVTCDLQSCETDDHTVAVAHGECAGDTHHESCAVARHSARLIEALAKVRR